MRRSRIPLLGLLLVTLFAQAAPYDFDDMWGDAGRFVVPDEQSIRSALLQDDGGLVLIMDHEALRLRTDGAPDEAFAAGGIVASPLPDLTIAGATRRPDGRLDIVWRSEPVYTVAGVVQCLHRQWMRYTPNGRPDDTFNAGAGVNLDGGCSGEGLVGDANGATYWISSGGVSFTGIYYVNINHYDATGNRLADLDSVTQDFRLPPLWEPTRLVIDVSGRVVASARLRDQSTGFGAIRYKVSGRDPAFGEDGVAFQSIVGFVEQAGVLPMPDGRLLAYGAAYSAGRAQPVIIRFAENGDVDRSFGINGFAVLPLARAGESLGTPVIARLPDGRIIVAADVSSSGITYSRVGRMLADGEPDLYFAGGGVAPVIYGPGVHSLFVRTTGEIVLGLESEVVQLRGGDLVDYRPLRERRVVEFVNQGYGDYFISADEPEIASLDSAPDTQWVRTGESFDVYDEFSSRLVPMCRFWSDQSFAPKSSHFYTPYADECARVKTDPTWLFEHDAFYAQLPEGIPGARSCPSDTRPLYRAYNNGMGGAPNHRYTTDPAMLDAMIAQGWVLEGEATTRVFACVPVQ